MANNFKFLIIFFTIILSSNSIAYDHRDYSFESYDDLFIDFKKLNKLLYEVNSLNDIILAYRYDSIEKRKVKASYPVRNMANEYFDLHAKRFSDLEKNYIEKINSPNNSNIIDFRELIENKDLSQTIINLKCSLYVRLDKSYYLNKYNISLIERSSVEFKTLMFLFSQSQKMICENNANLFKFRKNKLGHRDLKLHCDENLGFLTNYATANPNKLVSSLLDLTKLHDGLSDRDFYLTKEFVKIIMTRTLSGVYDLNKACAYQNIIIRTMDYDNHLESIAVYFYELDSNSRDFRPEVINPPKQ